ncbi:DUF2884 family protein [Cellvibrio sp. UBA7661]|uniref:DUF2884 family protein n=1 Tax=Cellvibrio sp. UBA7661 TaxID=1946311 RepID=UPI002F35F2E9
MKIVIAGVCLAMACGVQAGQSCNINVQGDLSISKEAIRVAEEGRPVYEITRNHTLLVDGVAVALDDEQTVLLARYESQLRALVPQVKGVAVEGINMAATALSIAIDSLLGDGNKVSQQLRDELNGLKGDVQQYFSPDNTIRFNAKGDNTPDLLGDYFATRVERIVETSVQESLGDVLLALGREVLASGVDMEAFGVRMEKFGQQMEQQMNAKSALLETRGAALCDSIRALDVVEEQLKVKLPQVDQFNLLQVEAPAQSHII